MKVYGSNGNGCLVLVIITAILVMTVGFFGKILFVFGRLLFTTPLGIGILIALGVNYMLKQRKKSSTNSSFTQGTSHDEFNGESYTDDDNKFDRSDYLDVEEVDDYKNIDK
ncbi:MAG: hypothetical protein WBA54_11080 [Acidaminobacteraceae bacterium]